MKKIVLVCAMFMGVFGLSNMSASKVNDGKIPFNARISGLEKFLGLDDQQTKEVYDINEYFKSLQEQSFETTNKVVQDKRMKYALNTNLKLMKSTLNAEQYRKYLMLLNLTNNANQVVQTTDSTQELLAMID